MMRAIPPFPLGKILATPPAIQALIDADEHPIRLLMRHAGGDWGDVGEEDWAANDKAARSGGRILSAFRLKTGVTVWVLTESDRSATTTLLPDDY